MVNVKLSGRAQKQCCTQVGSFNVREKKKKRCTTTGYSCLKGEVAAKTSIQFYMEAEFRYQNLWHGLA